MFIHKTTGTVGYLDNIKVEKEDLYLQANGNTAVLYYEDENEKSVFNTDHSYEILNGTGNLTDKDPTLMIHIPASGIGKSLIIQHLSEFNRELEKTRGIENYRIATRTDDVSYLVLITFVDLKMYHDFKKSDIYKNYLTNDVLKKFQNEESIFQDFVTSQVYFTVDENKEINEEF